MHAALSPPKHLAQSFSKLNLLWKSSVFQCQKRQNFPEIPPHFTDKEAQAGGTEVYMEPCNSVVQAAWSLVQHLADVTMTQGKSLHHRSHSAVKWVYQFPCNRIMCTKLVNSKGKVPCKQSTWQKTKVVHIGVESRSQVSLALWVKTPPFHCLTFSSRSPSSLILFSLECVKHVLGFR